MPGSSGRHTPVALVVAGVVHVEAKPVAGAVHVEALVVARFDHPVEIAANETEIDEALRQDPHRRLVRLVPSRARAHGIDRGVLRCQHQFVDLALRRTEASVHGERARDVGGVAVDLAAGVDQQQIAVAAAARRSARNAARRRSRRRHDRRVGRRLRALAPELVQELRLDLVSRACRAGRVAWRDGARQPRCRAARRISASSSASLRSRISSSSAAHVVNPGRGRDARCARCARTCVQPAGHARVPAAVRAQGAKKRRLIGRAASARSRRASRSGAPRRRPKRSRAASGPWRKPSQISRSTSFSRQKRSAAGRLRRRRRRAPLRARESRSGSRSSCRSGTGSASRDCGCARARWESRPPLLHAAGKLRATGWKTATVAW